MRNAALFCYLTLCLLGIYSTYGFRCFQAVGQMQTWFKLALQPAVVRRSLKVSLLVGTLLTLINQLPRLLEQPLNMAIVLQIILTYMVPYAVSTYSAVEALRALGDKM